MKNKRTIAFILLAFFSIILINFLRPRVWDKNQTLLKAEILSIDQGVRTVNLLDVTPFEWDLVYSFEPYASKEEIYERVGYKWDRISETVSEGMNQIVFMNESKVVCYLYGYPQNNAYGLYLPLMLEVGDDLNAELLRKDDIVYLTIK